MNAVVAGSTGLVGREVVAQLCQRPEVTVRALVRKTGTLPAAPNLTEVQFSVDQVTPADVLYCCIGTTMRAAGSPEAFRKVDLDIPMALIKQLVSVSPKTVFALVSSVGADRPGGLYLNTKAELEKALASSGLPYVIARPSMLLGERSEFRPLEVFTLPLVKPLMWGLECVTGRAAWVGRLKPIEGRQVARALIRATLEGRPVNRAIEGWELFE